MPRSRRRDLIAFACAVPLLVHGRSARAADNAPPTATDARICLNCHKPAPATLRGHWDGFAMSAASLQLKIDGSAQVLRFDPASLQIMNAPQEGGVERTLRSIKKGHEVRIEYADVHGTKVARVVAVKPPVKLAAHEKASLAEVEHLVAKPPATSPLFDARPAPRFKEGAIPTAVNLPFPEFDKLAGRLPADKSALVVFYCSGVTCNMSPGAQQKAKALGYTNVKVFVEGMPAWYAKHHGALTAESLRDAYRDVPHVLIDARATSTAETESLQGAAAGTAEVLKNLPPKELKAPIIVFDADGKGPATELAARIIEAGYVNVNVLSDGLAGAKLAGLPVRTGALTTQIAYVPKPKPGEIGLVEFQKLAAALPADAVLVDVRSAAEFAQDGSVKGSVNVPVEQLDASLGKLPGDRRIVCFCGTGTRAEMAYHILKANGFTRVAFVNAKIEFENGKATLMD